MVPPLVDELAIGPGPARSPHFCQKPEGFLGTHRTAGCLQGLRSCPKVPRTQGRRQGRRSWRPVAPTPSG